MNSFPLVSIIITTYYRNDVLKRAIESVKRQTYEPIEIVVVDDSGEANAREVVEEFDVKYIPKEQNEGQIVAWNTGIEHATGEFIQFLDDDDILLPTKIEKQVSVFMSNEDIGLVYCGMRWESGPTNLPNSNLRGYVIEEVLTLDTSPCVTSTILIKKDVIEDVFPIPEYPASTDDVLKIELAQVTKFDFVNECLIIRGTGEDNVPTDNKINVWKQLLVDYNDVYTSYPKKVYFGALSNIYFKESRFLLKTNLWSFRARYLFFYSIYKQPELNKKNLTWLLRLFGGEHVIKLKESISNILAGEEVFTRK